MILNIDVDGVLCNLISGYLELVKKATGKTFKHDDVTDYKFKCLGLTAEEEIEVLGGVFRPGWCRNLQTYPGTYEGIANLEKDGHEIYFVTSSWKKHPTWASEREAWLCERWPDAKIISTDHKHRVHADVFVDDKIQHVLDWARTWKGQLGLVWDAPYNRSKNYPKIPRVLDWDELHEMLRFSSGLYSEVDDPFRVGE